MASLALIDADGINPDELGSSVIFRIQQHIEGVVEIWPNRDDIAVTTHNDLSVLL
jgi:hypothetical protein